MNDATLPRTESAEFADLISQLDTLREDVARRAVEREAQISALPENRRASARNLVHYLALRQFDLRPVQERLARLGLSSIGRAESQVIPTLDAILFNLRVISGRVPPPASSKSIRGAFDELASKLDRNTERLLGEPPKRRRARIMVTMPAAAADDYMMVHHVLENGADCIRINCAHDDQDTWGRIVEQKRHAERSLGRSCRVLMDLRGPKLRSGPFRTEAGVLKIRPHRDAVGRVTGPARVWLSSDPDVAQKETPNADACLQLGADWLRQCQRDDEIVVRDARGKRRILRIVDRGSDGCWAELGKTVYLMKGSRLTLKRNVLATTVQGIPEQEPAVRLREGDTVVISGHDEPGKPPFLDRDGNLLSPGRISLPVPEIYDDVRPGEPVGFDDGHVCGIVERNCGGELHVRITHTRKGVEKIASDKGINFPDSMLHLPALSAEDLNDLPFIARHADMIALSFTNTPEDVAELRSRLAALQREDIGLVVKIETKRGFYNLPGILFEALKFPACGVMIARGDLAAECGFERLAEVQEQILWICESAHVPVIWATQVLEGLTKQGHATRAEITDAAMSQDAECVMLNKGPYIAQSVRALDDILRRMQDHKEKKRSMLRRLQLAAAYFRQDA